MFQTKRGVVIIGKCSIEMTCGHDPGPHSMAMIPGLTCGPDPWP